MNQAPTQCPVCNRPVETTRVDCTYCDTRIEGHFHASANPFAVLTLDQMQFALTFIRCEGRFNRMEEDLKLSYPTLRNRLYEMIRALGYEPGREEPPVRLTSGERLHILDELAEGRITAVEAQNQLKGQTAPQKEYTKEENQHE